MFQQKIFNPLFAITIGMPRLPIIYLELEICRHKPVYTIDNPSVLANVLPTLLDMIKSGWIVKTGNREWVQYMGESLANWLRIAVVVKGTMTSVLLYSDIDTVKERIRRFLTNMDIISTRNN